MPQAVLARYGAIPEVARFESNSRMGGLRGSRVVLQTQRGLEIGTLLQTISSSSKNNGQGSANGAETEVQEESQFRLVRQASAEDESRHTELRRDAEQQFDRWKARIADWELQLELIDLEWTLDRSKLILYVLNERGPDCTKLALQAAAAGLGVIEVQPVDRNGLLQVDVSTGRGCGSGGCGCHH